MGKKILIIEDSPTVLGMLKGAFENEGYEAITAENGEEGVKKAKAEKPDLVIADTLLPGIDGFEACRRIKDALGHEPPKVIVITGAVDAIDALKARKSGADDYCAKTSDFSPLIEAVKKLT